MGEASGGERGAVLAGTDRFLRAKRNVLFWAVSLIAIEMIHTNNPLKPSALGAELAIPPKLLIAGLTLILLYHTYGFWWERRYVIRQNSLIAGSGSSGTWASGLSDAERKINEQVALSNTSGDKARDKIDSLEAAFRSMKSTVEATVKEKNERLNQIAAGLHRLFEDTKDTGKMPTRASHGSTYFWWSNGIEVGSNWEYNDPIFQQSINELRDAPVENSHLLELLKNTRTDLYTIGDHVDTAERRTFFWYDTAPTFLLVFTAIMLCAVDLAFDKRVTSYLPRSFQTTKLVTSKPTLIDNQQVAHSPDVRSKPE